MSTSVKFTPTFLNQHVLDKEGNIDLHKIGLITSSLLCYGVVATYGVSQVCSCDVQTFADWSTIMNDGIASLPTRIADFDLPAIGCASLVAGGLVCQAALTATAGCDSGMQKD